MQFKRVAKLLTVTEFRLSHHIDILAYAFISHDRKVINQKILFSLQCLEIYMLSHCKMQIPTSLFAKVTLIR